MQKKQTKIIGVLVAICVVMLLFTVFSGTVKSFTARAEVTESISLNEKKEDKQYTRA